MPKASDYLVAVCDGHGKDTPGKRTPYISSIKRAIQENDFNKMVVKFLDEELKRSGFRTLLVAPSDADTPLSTRISLANAKKADAYISIHYDALGSSFKAEGSQPEGHTIFVYEGQSNGKSGKLAKSIHKYLTQGTNQKDRGVREANYAVLRETNMPSILSENGFMDNTRESLLMIDPKFQKEVAVEHARGICDYFGVPYVKELVYKKPAHTPKNIMYKVQVGAFGEKKNADATAKKLTAAGYKPVVVLVGKMYKVQVGAFSLKENADKLVKDLQAKKFQAFVAS